MTHSVPDPAMAEQRMRHWLSGDVEILTGFTEDCRAVLAELDRLRGKNTKQGLALAQVGHELAQFQAWVAQLTGILRELLAAERGVDATYDQHSTFHPDEMGEREARVVHARKVAEQYLEARGESA